MTISQGNSLCSYLKHQKCHIFLSFTKQKGRTGPALGVGNREREEGVGGRISCRYCVYIYVNRKIIPVETIPGMQGGELRKNGRGINSNMLYLMYCKNFCKCHNIYPHPTQR
jgi:hypothetical protein